MKDDLMQLSDITSLLFQFQDLGYRDFHSKLMPTIDKELIIGVRIPKIRQIAKQIKGLDVTEKFLTNLPHKYYEENNLHAYLIENQKDYHECIYLLEKFLPYIDNWATCDTIKPKIFNKYKSELFNKISIWINSNNVYTIRFAINMLMTHFLDEEFDKTHFNLVLSVNSSEYYVKMAIAWYFATALAMQYESAIKILLDNKINDVWTHNKTIQKAIESNRISLQRKLFLKTLKRK